MSVLNVSTGLKLPLRVKSVKEIHYRTAVLHCNHRDLLYTVSMTVSQWTIVSSMTLWVTVAGKRVSRYNMVRPNLIIKQLQQCSSH